MDIIDWLDAQGTAETRIAYDLIKSQQAEITRLKKQNEKYRKALVEVVSPEISYDVMIGLALKALSEDK